MRRGFAPRPDRTAEPLVRFENVSRRFGDVAAVDRLSLDIYRDEFFALLGPSGCGKTTLLRLLAGFERPDEGRIMLGGRDIVATPPHRRPVNMMFQSYALFPHLTVAGNIAFGLRQDGIAKAAIDEQPRSRWVAEFVGDVNLIDGLVLETGGREAVIGDKSGRRYRVAADVAKGAAKGAQVSIALRPEKVRIQAGPAPHDAPNAMRGQVCDIGYLGGVSIYKGRLDDRP